jgi:hypothetical protein
MQIDVENFEFSYKVAGSGITYTGEEAYSQQKSEISEPKVRRIPALPLVSRLLRITRDGTVQTEHHMYVQNEDTVVTLSQKLVFSGASPRNWLQAHQCWEPLQY